jgi:hypothetical protein
MTVSMCHCFVGYADYMQCQEFEDGLQQLLQEAEVHGTAAYMCAEMVSRQQQQQQGSSRNSTAVLDRYAHQQACLAQALCQDDLEEQVTCGTAAASDALSVFKAAL